MNDKALAPFTALSWLRRRGPKLPDSVLHRLFRRRQVCQAAITPLYPGPAPVFAVCCSIFLLVQACSEASLPRRHVLVQTHLGGDRSGSLMSQVRLLDAEGGVRRVAKDALLPAGARLLLPRAACEHAGAGSALTTAASTGALLAKRSELLTGSQ